MIWHSADISDVTKELGVDESVGLSAAEIPAKITFYGENKQTHTERPNILSKILRHLAQPVDIILLVVAAVVFAVNIILGSDQWYIPIIIFVLLALNATADVLTGLKANNEMEQLKGNIAPKATVLRDGELQQIAASLLVPGDIVVLEQGNYIPADGRLLESFSLTCDESAVTDDAAPTEKQADFLPDDMVEIKDRKNMVHAGCSVLFGRGKMVVTDTGLNTELARKNAITQITEGNDIPVKKKLIGIGRISHIIVLITCLVIFIAGVLRDLGTHDFTAMVFNMLLTAAALAVAAIPEEAAQAVDIALGFGAHRILKHKAVIKNNDAVETLGHVSVIISDKTGTLTKNRMKMTMLYDGTALCDLNLEAPGENAVTVIRTAALCTNSDLELLKSGKKQAVGDPTEAAIIGACMEYCGMGKNDIENIYPRMAEVPFDSTRKLMSTINMINNKPFAIVKGSPDILLQFCTAGNLKGAAEATNEMNKRGLRTIAVAIKALDEVTANPTPENTQCDLTLLGVFGMSDTISRETTAALRQSELAGIRTVMITGDHVIAAETVAKSLGIMQEGQKSVTGEELAAMTDEELADEIYNIAVYSRISAEDKLRIVNTFKLKGEVVAATGDSVDDAPVLRAADVGCAMGVTGTDIAKGNADVVLLEDSYISVVGAIRESRGIFSNIKRIASFVISCAAGELMLMLFEVLVFGLPALSAPALLWLNLVVGFGLGIGLCAEGSDEGDMLIPPRPIKQIFFSRNYIVSLLLQGGWLLVLGLISYTIGGSATLFVSLVMAETMLAFSLRAERSILKTGILTNKVLLSALGVSVLSIILLVCTPISGIFALGGITFGKLILAMLLGFVPLIASEAYKFFEGRKLK